MLHGIINLDPLYLNSLFVSIFHLLNIMLLVDYIVDV